MSQPSTQDPPDDSKYEDKLDKAFLIEDSKHNCFDRTQLNSTQQFSTQYCTTEESHKASVRPPTIVILDQDDSLLEREMELYQKKGANRDKNRLFGAMVLVTETHIKKEKNVPLKNERSASK